MKEFDKEYLPIIHIDKSLEKYKGKVIFKEKLDEANKTLKRVGFQNQRIRSCKL